MISHVSKLPRIAAAVATILLSLTPATSQEAEVTLAETIARVEADLDARIGVLVRDSSSDWQWGHRAEERFLMASTFKSVLCGAVLERVDDGTLSLEEPLEVHKEDVLEYAPVTEPMVGASMSIARLCLATLDMSDNTAANLLIDRLGGPGEVTVFLRGIGDEMTRLDRKEPEVNIFDPDDPRDTTTPAAMLASWHAMLLGDALSPDSQALLRDWMGRGGVTGKLLRASTPDDWTVADKSGAGEGYTRNLVAMITPPGDAPYLVAIYLSDTPADFAARDAAVAEISAAVIAVLQARLD